MSSADLEGLEFWEDRTIDKMIATIVAGWKDVRMSRGKPFSSDDEGIVLYNELCGRPPGSKRRTRVEVPRYSASVDVILKLMPQTRWSAIAGPEGHIVDIALVITTLKYDVPTSRQHHYVGRHKVLARAMCLALLNMHTALSGETT